MADGSTDSTGPGPAVFGCSEYAIPSGSNSERAGATAVCSGEAPTTQPCEFVRRSAVASGTAPLYNGQTVTSVLPTSTATGSPVSRARFSAERTSAEPTDFLNSAVSLAPLLLN